MKVGFPELSTLLDGRITIYLQILQTLKILSQKQSNKLVETLTEHFQPTTSVISEYYVHFTIKNLIRALLTS